MIAYQKEKIENAICFFANEHKKHTRYPLFQTMLYKYISYLEFNSIEKTGRPVFDLTYIAWKNGPVPKEIYDKRNNYNTSLFVFIKNSEGNIEIKPKEKPNLDYFSKYEISEMNRLIEIFAEINVRAKHMSEASHSDIKAWKLTWMEKPNTIIDKSLTFGKGLFNKKDGQLTFAEESFLTYMSIQNNLNECR